MHTTETTARIRATRDPRLTGIHAEDDYGSLYQLVGRVDPSDPNGLFGWKIGPAGVNPQLVIIRKAGRFPVRGRGYQVRVKITEATSSVGRYGQYWTWDEQAETIGGLCHLAAFGCRVVPDHQARPDDTLTTRPN